MVGVPVMLPSEFSTVPGGREPLFKAAPLIGAEGAGAMVIGVPVVVVTRV